MVATLVMGAIFTDSYFKIGVTKSTIGVLSPVGMVVTNVGSRITGIFTGISNIHNLQKENSRLKNELNSSLAEIARLSESQKENESLKKDLKFKEENNLQLVTAYVVFFDPSNIRDSITINIGTDDGIKEGNVAVSEGFLIGKVHDVTAKTAKIILISDPDSAVPVNVVGSNVSGILKGKIGNGLTLDQVPQSDKISSGDMLVTSGLGGQYQKGLLVGKVDSIQQISGSIFQAIEVRPMVNLDNLQRVMVIKK